MAKKVYCEVFYKKIFSDSNPSFSLEWVNIERWKPFLLFCINLFFICLLVYSRKCFTIFIIFVFWDNLIIYNTCKKYSNKEKYKWIYVLYMYIFTIKAFEKFILWHVCTSRYVCTYIWEKKIYNNRKKTSLERKVTKQWLQWR